MADWEATLDACFERMVTNEQCPIPGLVALAYCKGKPPYQKAFGSADKEAGTPMTTEAIFRIFSMTKVLASTVLLMLAEEYVKTGACESVDAFLESEVASLIPSFQRPFSVVEAAEAGDATAPGKTVDYTSFLTGETHRLAYETKPAARRLLVKHLMAEASGIGYDQWADIQLWLPQLELGLEYGAAQALRREAAAARGSTSGAFSSNCITGQDASLAEYTDAIAEAGVLVSEPGTFSYGLGALVVGRVVEVLYERLRGVKLRFAHVVEQMLFAPLQMASATFYMADGDARAALVPTLYGGKMRPDGDGCDALPYDQCVPDVPSLPKTVATDAFAGPRRCDSGDTGACMTAADYSKFYRFLLDGGAAPDGSRLLSADGVRRLTHGTFTGLERGSPVGKLMGLDDEASQSFNYGWAVRPAGSEPHCNHWSGYANNHGRLYVEDEAYVLVFPQFMGSTPGGWLLGGKTVRDAVTETFEGLLKGAIADKM